MSAFMCLWCADDGCEHCSRPVSPEWPLLLASVIAVVAGVAIAVLSCRGSHRWWM